MVDKVISINHRINKTLAYLISKLKYIGNIQPTAFDNDSINIKTKFTKMRNHLLTQRLLMFLLLTS